MSAFEIKLTPTRYKNKKNESKQPTEVIMAPFSGKSIVLYEDVPVTKTAKRLIRIINPSEDDIQISVCKSVAPEHNVTLEWLENSVPAQSQISMELIWSPKIVVSCQETVRLIDNRNFQKDVIIILKSKPINQVKNIRKFPTLSSGNSTHVKTLRLKSPTNAANKAINRLTRQTQPQKQGETQNKHLGSSKCKLLNCNKNTSNSFKHIKDSRKTILHKHTSPLMERNVYKNNANELLITPAISPHTLNSETEIIKENISPIPVNCVLNTIDELTFTPAMVSFSKFHLSQLNISSSLTTRNSCKALSPTLLTRTSDRGRDLNPRCLYAELHCEDQSNEDGHNDSKGTTAVITNKTFDVKLNESLETSSENHNFSNDYLQTNACPINVNKTTVISTTPINRHLDIIQEEENSPCSHNAASKAEKQTVIKTPQKCEKDLKRDIKLVASPLRKYSESLKNLHTKSPQSIALTQGSLPNLNNMESIKSFEQNRYFLQATSRTDVKKSNHITLVSAEESYNNKSYSHKEFPAELNITHGSLISHHELQFNQNEILAQSSRFNLNEVGIKKCKNSPTFNKNKNLSSAKSNTTPHKILRRLNTVPELQKRQSKEISFSDSQSMDSVINGVTVTSLVVNSTKPSYGIGSCSNLNTSGVSSGVKVKDWSQRQPKKFNKVLSLAKKSLAHCKLTDERPIKLYEADLFLQPYINPDPFAATTTCDPFLASTMYLDEASVEKHQIDFKKWLNALVTMPADLDTDSNTKIDVGKLFNEVRHKDLVLAPTKEEQSMNYLNNLRLESLRKAAVELFLSEEMHTPCSKVAVYVKKNSLRIRSDRNLHLDVVTQRDILQLLLCFNPLWLRLGLEVVYGEKIHLQSNRDIVGLSSFILNRLFRDKFLEQKYSKAFTLCDEYADHIKKFTLQKFLFLLLFLDKAKEKRIIAHNPCLFIKKSPHKETREILLRFSSELLANIGDVTKELKRLGYVLTHKQSYLDEFDYAFHNLAVDLRDGVRLTRVMEIILLRDDLTKQLRTPAISRSQKIHNVKLALQVLSESNFQLKGNITECDIVDGHREKTLSLLWQIIYKFRSPKFHAAATTIQKWWRLSWLRVVIQRRIRHKKEQRKQLAAIKIQAFYRGYVSRRMVSNYKQKYTQAAIVIQKYLRGYIARKRYLKVIHSTTLIKKWLKSSLIAKRCRENFLELRKSAICLQKHWRSRAQARVLKHRARLDIQLRNSMATLIQAKWRCYKLRKEFLRTVSATLVLQRSFRANLLMRSQRKEYLEFRNKVVRIQLKWKSTLLARKLRVEYLSVQYYTLVIQQKFRAKKLMAVERENYLKLLSCVIKIQRRFRATLQERLDRNLFLRKLQAVKTIQSYFRANKEMRYQRQKFQATKEAVICIQVYFKGFLKMKRDREKFLLEKRAAIVIQTAYDAYRKMKWQRKEFLSTKQAITFIQIHWRATLVMRSQRLQYLKMKSAIIFIQTRFRARLLANKVRTQYLLQRTTVITLQRRFRAKQLMLNEQKNYQTTRRSAIFIQNYYRSHLLRKQQMILYRQKRSSAIKIQRWFRAKKEKMNFLQLKTNIVKFQAQVRGFLARRRFHALMTPEMLYLFKQKRAAKIIQRFWRGYRIRKRLNNIRLELIRKNIALLKETSSSINSIKFKIQDAVRLLRGRFSASEALHVLMRLDRISRTVPHLLMCRSDFISTFCYGIMAQAIRSEVDKQLILYCSRIILNLARYNSTTANTFQEGGLVTIAQMLLRWCDKDCEIFNTLCTLIWIFAHCPVKRKIICDFMTTTDAIYMVRETKKLVARKEKMKQNVRKPAAAAITSFASAVSASSARGCPQQQNFSSRALPSLEPDYGVIHNKPYTFISSVYAFDALLCKLGIDIF